MDKQPTRQMSIVGVGAHMDDCYIGMGGIALKAARQGHRVTLVQLVSVYGAWPVVSDREAEVKPLLERLAADAGVSLVPMGYDYMRLENNPELVAHVSRLLDQLRPDILFIHAEDDSNQDHVVAGQAARIAGMHAACFLDPKTSYLCPSEIYQFGTGYQTRNFLPDVFVEIDDELFDVLEIIREIDLMYWKHTSERPDELTVTESENGGRSVRITSHGMAKLGSALTYGVHAESKFGEGFTCYTRPRAGASHLCRL